MKYATNEVIAPVPYMLSHKQDRRNTLLDEELE